MKNKLNSTIKSLMLTATASLLSGHVQANESTSSTPPTPNPNDKQIDVLKKQNIIKGVYKILRNGDSKLIAAHRSHRSHRSHSSHRSSSSGYGTSSYSHSTTTYSSSYGSSSYKHYSSYKLGERIIRRKTYGSDVNQLVFSLHKKGYIRNTKKLKKKHGYYVYDDSVEAAFNQFQRDAGLSLTYAADTASQAALEKWEFMNTNLMLGDREIRFVDQDFGPDVAQLVNVLNILGYQITSESMTYNGTQPYYSTEMMKAVIDFQSKNKLQADGVVNDKTANILKQKAKVK